MTIYLKKDTAAQEVPIGQFLSSTDGDSEKTALTIASTDVYLWKNGSTALVNVTSSNNAVHMAKGIYYMVFDATDTNTAGPLLIYSHPTGALTARQECMVLPALVYDSLVAGTDALQVDTIQVSGTTQAARDIGLSVLVGDKTGFALTTAQHDLIGARVWTETARTITVKTGFTLTTADHALIGTAAWAVGTRALTDKVAFALTTAQHTLIGTETWAIPTRAITDKADFTLTTANHDLIGLRVWNESTKALTDKVGYTLTTADHALIGTAGWAVAARSLTDKASFTLTSAYDAAKTAANSSDVLDLPTLTEIEASTVLAKEATLGEVNSLVGGYSISAPTYSTSGKMLTATITAGTTTRSVTATYTSDDNMATYTVTS
jgi:hypothetical protein